MAQARRAGKNVGRPIKRNLLAGEIEKMKSLRSNGASIRHLATEFGTSQ
jgi:hypothetical protein